MGKYSAKHARPENTTSESRGRHMRPEEPEETMEPKHFEPPIRTAPLVNPLRNLRSNKKDHEEHRSHTEEVRQDSHRERHSRRSERRPHHRDSDVSHNIKAILRSPAFAYVTAAVLITGIIYVLTIPTPKYLEFYEESTSTVMDKPKPTPKNDDPVEPREVKHKLEGSSADAVRKTNAYGVLTQAIGEFEDTDDEISIAVHDLTNGNELTYDSGRIQYPASSIKAPYTTCVYQELVETGEADIEEVYPLAEPTIIESSDDTYHDLHDRYGSDVFKKWLEDAEAGYDGYDSYDEMLTRNYPHMCTNQLLKMWLHIYDYLETDTAPAHQLENLLSTRSTSAMRDALGSNVRTWGKMGWFDVFGDYESEPATVEAGIVFAEEGPYAVAVMTTAPAQISALEPIFTAIARAHYDMV